MKFRASVLACPQLAGHYQEGLQALAKAHRLKVTAEDSRQLTGSVNVDNALRLLCPKDPRWDYGVGIEWNKQSEFVVWIEVHPASSTHVQPMLAKLAWLKKWMAENAAALSRMPGRFVWLATGSVALTPTSRQSRQIAQHGLVLKTALSIADLIPTREK